MKGLERLIDRHAGRRCVAVFRLDGTHSRYNLEELEEKNEIESKDTTI
jgi:hypothetical protein